MQNPIIQSKSFHLLMTGLFLCLSLSRANAQESFDLQTIEQELVFQLDQFRQSEGLPKFQRTEVLDAIAFDQAEYIAEKGRLTHEQDKEQKKTLLDRLLYYEALNAEAGENLAMVSPNSRGETDASSGRVELVTVDLLVKAAIYSWIEEEESQLNLTDSNFYEMGIGVHQNERKEFVIVAVFASLPYVLPKGVKQKFKFRGIDPYKEEACKEFESQFGTAAELFSDAFVVEEGKLYFSYHNKKVVEKMLSLGGSAISAEIMVDRQFACGESNRLFPGEITDGYLMPQVKKGVFLSMTEEEQKQSGVKLFIGEVPEQLLSENYEVNGIIVQNGCKCANIPFNKLKVDNEKWLDLPFKLVTAKEDSIPNLDTLYFKIPLTKDEEFKQAVLDLDELFSHIEFEIEGSTLTKALSPIEESAAADKALEVLSNRLKEADFVSAEQLNTIVQWEKYRAFEKNTLYQIETQEMDSLAEMTYLKETAKNDEELANFLNDLNQLEVELYGNIQLKENLTQEERLGLFHFLRKRGEGKLALELLNQMIANKEQGMAEVLSERDRLDQNKADLPLINNLMVAAIEEGRIVFDGNPMATAFLEIHLINQSQRTIRYNYLIATLKSWSDQVAKVNRLDEWESSYEKLRAFLSPELYARGLLNFKMITADHYYETGKGKEREDAFKELMKLLPRAKLKAAQHYKIAQYLAYQDQSSRAIEALVPVVKQEEVAQAHLFYFLQLAIYDEELVPDSLFLEILDKLEASYPEEYCRLFSKTRMGIQPLKDYQIKARYCKRCAK